TGPRSGGAAGAKVPWGRVLTGKKGAARRGRVHPPDASLLRQESWAAPHSTLSRRAHRSGSPAPAARGPVRPGGWSRRERVGGGWPGAALAGREAAPGTPAYLARDLGPSSPVHGATR